MWLLSHSSTYVKIHGYQMKSLVTGKSEILLSLLKREKRARDLQGSEPHLYVWKDHGADSPGSHFKAHTRQRGERASISSLRADCALPIWWPSRRTDSIRGQSKDNCCHLPGLLRHGTTLRPFL